MTMLLLLGLVLSNTIPQGTDSQPCDTHIDIAHDHEAARAACDYPGCNNHGFHICSGDVNQPNGWACYAGNSDSSCTGVTNGQGVQTINGRRTHC